MIGPSIIDAIKFSVRIVNVHLALQPGEEVVIIADSYTERPMLDALAGAIAGVGGEYTIVTQPARTTPESIHQITRSALAAYEGADVIIPATGSCGVSQYGASHVLWPLLAARKARVFTLSERSLSEMTEGAAGADYLEVEKIGLSIIEAMGDARDVRITTELGTDLTMSLAGIELINLASFSREPGQEGGIPSGEVTANPVVGSANGVAVIDGPIGYVGRPARPIRLLARDGLWVDVEGDTPEADKLRHFFDEFENARNVAEFALGTNAWARKNGVVSEEKKRFGTAHTAFGRSTRTSDWRCEVWSKVHGDLVIYQPTVEVDGRHIMRSGDIVA